MWGLTSLGFQIVYHSPSAVLPQIIRYALSFPCADISDFYRGQGGLSLSPGYLKRLWPAAHPELHSVQYQLSGSTQLFCCDSLSFSSPSTQYPGSREKTVAHLILPGRRRLDSSAHLNSYWTQKDPRNSI